MAELIHPYLNAPYPLNEIVAVRDTRELIEHWNRAFGERVAFRYCVEEGGAVVERSYQQFRDDIVALATAFLDLGLRGCKIAVIGENSYQWLLTYFAAINSGNVIVPLDRDLSTKEVRYLLENSESKAWVHTAKFSEMIAEIKPQLPMLEHCFLSAQGESELLSLVEKGHRLREAGDRRYEGIELDVEVCTALLYTSGTTGVSKGVMLSQKNLIGDLVNTLMNVYLQGQTVLVLPLHHSFTMMAVIFCTMHYGCTVCINKSLKDLSADLQLFQPDFLFLVPMIVEALYKRVVISMRRAGREAWFKEVSEHVDALFGLGIDVRRSIFKQVLDHFGGKLQMIISGGAALDPSYIEKYHSLGIALRNGYGITECSPVVAVNRNDHHKTGTIGQPVGNTEIMILDPNEQGEGEICVKSDIVMVGYYKNPEATAAAFIDGWFRTGDIGTFEDGFLSISGRAKNVIILSNGKNIYPEELEMHVANIPGVKEVLVYGLKGVITAEIFPDSEFFAELSAADIAIRLQQGIDAVNAELPRHKKIVDLRVREKPFLRTGSNKIVRSQVQEQE